MNGIYNLKILIVGLTTVLALTNNKIDFRNDFSESGFHWQLKI